MGYENIRIGRCYGANSSVSGIFRKSILKLQSEFVSRCILPFVGGVASWWNIGCWFWANNTTVLLSALPVFDMVFNLVGRVIATALKFVIITSNVACLFWTRLVSILTIAELILAFVMLGFRMAVGLTVRDTMAASLSYQGDQRPRSDERPEWMLNPVSYNELSVCTENGTNWIPSLQNWRM